MRSGLASGPSVSNRVSEHAQQIRDIAAGDAQLEDTGAVREIVDPPEDDPSPSHYRRSNVVHVENASIHIHWD